MDPFASQTKLIELAYDMATANSSDDAELLRRFRVIYRHMSASVNGLMLELGQGPYGPMGPMPGMQMPDAAKLMAETDAKLSDL